MRDIINGTIYDTDTASAIGTLIDDYNDLDLSSYTITAYILYLNEDDKYFLYIYSFPFENEPDIFPLDDFNAKSWLDKINAKHQAAIDDYFKAWLCRILNIDIDKIYGMT